MTRDDFEQVTYKCSQCGKTHTIDDTNLARIEKTFEENGWANVPTPGLRGKVNYDVFCPTCCAKGVQMVEDHAVWEAEQDSLDMERPGLW